MCGIAGALCLAGPLDPERRDVVARLNLRQKRRGPDGEGLWTSPDGSTALGHRRLAIIDVGDSGAQPMSDATGRWTVTFNGEIYNYRELRRELEAAGRRFVTNSDTEVLINCIAEWGELSLEKMRGMYAFALWDDQEKELWLARDPFGIKPLYYAQSGSVLWFASQARALADCAPVDTERRPAGLVAFHLWGAIPEPFTWWRGIQALPAGRVLRVSRRNGAIAPAPAPAVRLDVLYSAGPAEPLSSKELKQAFLDSVTYHHVSDVTVGVFLSAGVDSTAVVALAKEAGFNLHTVTLAFDEFKGTAYDEAPIAEETARRLGAEHKTIRVGKDEFYGLFDDFLATMDQPTTDGLNTYLVSRAASTAGLKVVLSGLGGDELLGGYPSFRQAPKLVAFARRLPFRRALGDALSLAGQPIMRALNGRAKIAGLLRYSGDIESAYFLRRCLYLPEELDLLLDESWTRAGLEELAATLPGGDPARRRSLESLSPYAAVSLLEIESYLRMQPLRDTDWASMAHSLEVRVPFLDLPLLARLAPAINSERPPTKLDLAASIGAPMDLVAGRAKTGFATPIESWLGQRAGQRPGLKPWADRVATSFRTAAGGC